MPIVEGLKGLEGLVQAEPLGSRSASPGQKVPIQVKGVSSRGRIEPLLDRPLGLAGEASREQERAAQAGIPGAL